jgi:hypothetical protein
LTAPDGFPPGDSEAGKWFFLHSFIRFQVLVGYRAASWQREEPGPEFSPFEKDLCAF